MNANYKATIADSSRELTAKERVKFKDITDAVKLDLATQDGEVIIKPEMFVVLDIHNEKAKGDKDYKNYVVVDADGTKYTTGSNSFWNSFMNIYAEMMASNETDWEIKAYRVPSRNYAGKDFITCAIL